MHPALPRGPHSRPVSTGDGDSDNHGDSDMVQGEAQAPPSAPGCGTVPGGGGAPLSATRESLVAPPPGRRPSLSCSCIC